MNAPLLRRLFRAALVVSVLFGTSSSLADSSPLGITTDPALPNALTDISYRQPVEASGGQGPYTWEIVDRADWPDWLYEYNLADSGELYGWPDDNDIGTHVFALRATDSEGRTAEKTFTLVVEKNPNHRPEIVSRNPSEYSFVVAIGETVRLSVKASDSDGDPLTYAWWGYDPNGNWFSSTGGEAFEFVPETNGFHEVNVNVGDGMFSCDTVSWRIWAGGVEPLEIVTETNLPDAMEGVPYSVRLEATGGAGGHQWEHSHFTFSHETNSFSETGAPLLDWNGRIWREEDSCFVVELPFDFPFANQTNSAVYVTDDGEIRHYPGYSWDPIIPFERNFDGERQTIYTNSPAEGAFTIRWDTFVYGTDDAAAFSATLYSDGHMRYSYGNVPDPEESSACAWGWWFDARFAEQAPDIQDIVLVPRGKLPDGLYVDTDWDGSRDVPVLCGTPDEGSAGTYSFDLSVADALGNKATKTFTLVVADNPNREPRIEARFPEREDVRVSPGESADFTVVATDPDGQPLRFEWMLEHGTYDDWGNWMWKTLVTNATTGSESTFVLPPLEESEEEYHLFCNIIDGPWTNYVGWWISVHPPLAIVTETLPDTTEMVDYEVRLVETNAMGSVEWSIDENPYAVRREPNSFAVSGSKILGKRSDGDDFDSGTFVWSMEIELPFAFPFEGRSSSSVEVSLNGSLDFQDKQEYENGTTIYSLLSIYPCRFSPDVNRTEAFLDESVPGQVTFTWCGEGTSTWSNGDSDGENVSFHFSATLYEDGSVRFSYGDGNLDSPQYWDVQIGNQWLYDCFHDGMSQVDDVVLLPRSVPPGLTVTADGILSGRPTHAGSYVFDVQADDGWQTTNRTLTLVVEENGNRPVVVDSFAPTAGSIERKSDYSWSVHESDTSLFLGESRTYSVVAHDPEGEELSFEWSIDGTVVPDETGTSFTYVVSEADMAFDEYGDSVRERMVKCSISDGLWTRDIEWEIRFARTWYVDANSMADDPDGLSWESAFPSLVDLENAWSACSGDLVLVAPGVYSSKRIQTYSQQSEDGNGWIEVEETVPIRLSGLKMRSTGGPFQTVIDGEGEVSLPSGCSGFTGFTLRNGAPDRFALSLYDQSFDHCIFDHCIVSNCTFVYGGFTSCTFENCAIAGNTAENGPLFSSCRLFHCTVVDNRSPASDDYATLNRYCEVFNSIVWNNQDEDGAIRNYEHGPDFSTRFENCCLNEYHAGNPGLVFGNPMLAGSGNGDVRLREGSSCIDAGLTDWIRGNTDIAGRPRMQGAAPDIGAWEGVAATGHVVSVRVQGHGAVSPTSSLVPDGGSAIFFAEETVRPFRGFFDEAGNLLSSNSTWNAEYVRGDRTIVAVFETRTFHADATAGSDANDGLSWEKPKKTLQAAVDAAIDGERVLVAAGTYEPFRAEGKRIRIESVDGAERTIVDGGGTNRCATLGQMGRYGENKSTIVGVTLRNGFAKHEEVPHHGTVTIVDDEYYSNLSSGCGGGAYGGILIDCIVQSNHADDYGGGLYDSSAIRCLIVDNEVGLTGERVKSGGVWAYGGGASGSTLVNCLVSRNTACAVLNEDRAAGGGVDGGSIYNSTIVNNRLSGVGKRRGAGALNGTFYGCIIAQNDFDGKSGETFSGLEGKLSVVSTFIGDDPGFVDAANGNYRLRPDSPCIDGGELPEDAEEVDPDNLDLDGNPRVRGAAVDQGCYESAYEKTQTSTTPVPVPFAWLDSHYADLAIRGGYEDRANSTAANGVDEIWKCFVTGVVPTDGDDRFLATIEMENGGPIVSWSPDLNEGGTKNLRVYTVEGKMNLVDTSWGPTNAATRFFRVKVSLPE